MHTPNEKVTIVQIAQLAGVSVSTVSRVINNKGLVNQATRERVQAVIDRMNYTPNKLAQGLVNSQSLTIGLIIPNITNPFNAALIQGVEAVLTRHGYSMFLYISHADEEKENGYLMDLYERRAEGVIQVSSYEHNVPLLKKLNDNSMPVVCVQSKVEGIDCIGTWDYDSMFASTERLIELGHRKIAFLSYDHRATPLRFQAYVDAHKKHGIPLVPEYMMQGRWDDTHESPGALLAMDLLNLPTPPTAIQAVNDYLAFGAYRAIYEKGLRIPQDISVTGFDDLPLSALLTPPMTTVSQPALELGQIAANKVLGRINGSDTSEPKYEKMETMYIERQSTGPVKQA